MDGPNPRANVWFSTVKNNDFFVEFSYIED